MRIILPIVASIGVISACSSEIESNITGTWSMDADQSLEQTLNDFDVSRQDVAMSTEFLAVAFSNISITNDGLQYKDDDFELDCSFSDLQEGSAQGTCDVGMMSESETFDAQWEIVPGTDNGILIWRGFQNQTIVMQRSE
jgi:hypothetical protein